MPQLQKIAQGTPPSGVDGDTVRAGFAKVNANSDVLAACVALGYNILSDNWTLAPSNVGARFGLNMGAGGKVVKLPLSSSVSVNACVHFFNVGPPVTIGFQGSDGSQIKLLNTGDWATYIADGGTYWHVAERGRMLWDETVGGNLAVGGTLSVAKGIAGDLGASGKLVGVNSPNLLFNSSGELGLVGGWGPGGFIDAFTSVTAEGAYFSNPAAISASSYAGSVPIAAASGVTLTLSGEIYAGGVNAGSAWFRLVFLDASRNVISTSPNVAATNGAGWTFKSQSVNTPASTAYVYVQLAVEGSPPAVSFGGVAWRRLKLEKGSAPSLYSQEATIAYLGGSPAFAGRPTFGGKVPWDSGNMTRPALFSAAGGNTADLNPNAWEVRLSQTFVCGAGGIAMVTATAGLNLATGVSGACDVLARIRVVDGATVVFDGSDDVSTVSGTSDAGLGGRGKIVATGAAAGLTAGKTYTVQFLLRKNQPIGPLYPLNMQLMGITS
ncbi:hypothetical protein [Burkholderia cenocepacia]|uniref:hypothetical protein n=1 Tax=Burkholderia cenocepacia TaxID=95486 RepID=UPI001B94C0D2|nr:hypothetical protein [Burkholderia cenocepacia]MBR8509587.1 hypothetical protein [Burkholderia cenocepacia]